MEGSCEVAWLKKGLRSAWTKRCTSGNETVLNGVCGSCLRHLYKMRVCRGRGWGEGGRDAVVCLCDNL